MVKKAVVCGAVLLGASIGSSASAQDVGDWVLVPWQYSTVLYPAVVIGRNGTDVTVRYDAGATETWHMNDVYAYDWGRGSPITCQWTDGNWYDATILWAGDDGYSLRIEYDDDGIVQDTVTGNCRTREW